MENRVAIISVIVENDSNVDQLNDLLHTCGEYILGRMGIPYKKRKINIISIAIDAPQDTINSLAGKIGRIEGVVAKTVYSSNVYSADIN